MAYSKNNVNSSVTSHCIILEAKNVAKSMTVIADRGAAGKNAIKNFLTKS